MQRDLENILKSEIDPAFAKRARLILEAVDRDKPKKILDAGCGKGFYVQSLAYFPFIKEIHGFDINETYLKVTKENSSDPRSRIQKASIYSLPYPCNYFDFIICSEVLEHLEDDKKALLELKRVLKPGGILVVSVPNFNFPFLWDPLNWLLMKLFNTHINKNIWWLAGIWADHERLYTFDQLKKLITDCGFRIKKSRRIIHWCWPLSHFLLYGIGKNFVESFNLSTLSRFHIQNTRKPLSSLLALIFRLPTLIFDKEEKSSSPENSVTIFVELTK